MSGQTAPSRALEATYKLPEAEGILDLFFYRKIGFFLARFFARLGMSPVSVTLLGGAFGVIAGHLYYYSDLRINMIGFGLHILANAFDNADGQLARMTGRGSREGRIIDSVVDHIVFGSVYLHLTLRCLAEGASPGVWLLAIAAVASHLLQAGTADYFRNGFLYFAKGRAFAQLDSSRDLRSDYLMLSWRDQPLKKILIALCLNFTRQQEFLTPGLNRLRAVVDRQFPGEIPSWLKATYRDSARPLFKWFGLLMTNTRMIILLVVLLADQPAWFFWMQLTVFNGLLFFLMQRQGRLFRSLLEIVSAHRPLAPVGV
jgi:CDP-alcohol phosphatidyltransferase